MMDIFSLYTDEHRVMQELELRRNAVIDDSKMIETMKLTPSVEFLLKEPHLVLARQIATPLHETLRVMKLASELGLKFCILEYSADMMVASGNTYKRGLAKLPIFEAMDRNGHEIIHSQTVVDINSEEGLPFSKVTTLNDEPLIKFHHELLANITGEDSRIKVIDVSDWLSQFSDGPVQYYGAFFAFFIKHNVLAEVYIDSHHDKGRFTEDIIYPVFKSVERNFGFKPLIVNYQPLDQQDGIFWDCYPSETDDFLRKKGYIE